MFTDVDLVAIWLPYLRAKLKETTNRARAWPQIKTNSLMAYLFTQEINLFEQCTIRYTALLVACWYFFQTKMDTSISGFTAGLGSGSPQPHTGPRKWNPAPVQFAAGFPEEKSDVDLGTHSQNQPTNPAFFFQACWLKISMENWGRRKRGRQKERGGKTAPGLEGDIVCMCTQAQGLWPAA